jgi:hypothetical protein
MYERRTTFFDVSRHGCPGTHAATETNPPGQLVTVAVIPSCQEAGSSVPSHLPGAQKELFHSRKTGGTPDRYAGPTRSQRSTNYTEYLHPDSRARGGTNGQSGHRPDLSRRNTRRNGIHSIKSAPSTLRESAVDKMSRGQFATRRDGRVAEGARLESVYTLTGIGGSNPSLSARF